MGRKDYIIRNKTVLHYPGCIANRQLPNAFYAWGVYIKSQSAIIELKTSEKWSEKVGQYSFK